MPILEDRGKALENEYFHRKEKELIEKMKAKLAEENSKRLNLDCPRCDGKLVETEYENILVDICESCSGIWLDPEILTKVVIKEEKTGGWFKKIFDEK